MYAILYPLISAGGFAISSVIIRDLDTFGSPIFLNLLRTVIGAVMFLFILFVNNQVDDLLAVTNTIAIFLILSVIFNVVIGDTLYFKSQKIIGVKTATPIVNIYPFVTILFSIIFLSERFDLYFLLGSILIIIGIGLLSQEVKTYEDQTSAHERKQIVFAFIFAVIALFSYSLGVLFTTIGSVNVDVVIANSIRLPSGAIFLSLGVYLPRKNSNYRSEKSEEQMSRDYSKNHLVKMLIAGILGTYVSSFYLVRSAQELGAGKTAILTSVGPIFVLPLAAFWLKEKVGKFSISGTLLTIIGLWLIII